MATSVGSKIFRVFLVLVGLLLLAVGWLFLSFPKPEGPRVEASSKITGVLSPDMYAWIIRTEHGAALVDTGIDKTGQAILAELKKQGLTADQVHTVFITHGHADHTSGAILFNRARVYAGRGDLGIIRGTEKPVKLPALFARIVGDPAVPTEITALDGGETIDADGTPVKVIHTPGHTDGSMMFVVGEVVFTGDSLSGKGKELELAPSAFSKDVEQNRKSLEKLLDFPFTMIADGHTGAHANAREKLKRFLGRQ